jgi:hypothetical protein
MKMQVQDKINQIVSDVEEAGKVVEAGMKKADVFKFFENTKHLVGASPAYQYIALFGLFGVEMGTVWNMYHEWKKLQGKG